MASAADKAREKYASRSLRPLMAAWSDESLELEAIWFMAWMTGLMNNWWEARMLEVAVASFWAKDDTVFLTWMKENSPREALSKCC